ncbi:SLATT domain-containing protein [Streptomyces phaeochromogenes]|uniref:SLATT domain-containing protein n=1 Tax=Streptomyces phaeochromogenes TaxID=1923 RepID=A0ABZ1HHZ1_STRPH|nr:SLATT domain-containing protein [Streptomyces phaeochromogenes]MCX5597292.1 SLATT domain-containing protein [Streptomyces phaeochromogenes]WSD18240.1 SLATT domain-containing protein [Streptomyces phaeochromogenes]
MHAPSDPPVDKGGLAVVSYYIESYEKEYVRIRNFSKRRVSGVITLVAALNAGIAVLGVASAAWKYPWFGLASTVLAGFVGVLAARNNLFRDQELWQLRTVILSKLQQVKREMKYRIASGEGEQLVASEIMKKLDEILDQDLMGWSGVSRSAFAPSENNPPAVNSGN